MPDGAIVTGVTTATQFSGDLVSTASTITGIDALQLYYYHCCCWNLQTGLSTGNMYGTAACLIGM